LVKRCLARRNGWLNDGYYPAGRNRAKIFHLGLDVPNDKTRAREALEKCGEVVCLRFAYSVLDVDLDH
jgi:hypothetical protein